MILQSLQVAPPLLLKLRDMDHPPEIPFKVQLEAFLSRKRVLIVDPLESSRKATAKTLITLGVKTEHIIFASDYEFARELVHQVRPDIVITEYWLERGNGIALAREFNRIKLLNSIFIILTENALQSTVSAASEEDVDIYILKPYLSGYFSKVFTRTVYLKLNPSVYLKQISQGKKYLVDQSWDQAIQWFNNAIHSSEKPSLAYYYRSRAEIEKFLYDTAEQSLKNGLKYNEVHYKCLTGLFDLLLMQGKFKDAYPVVKRLINFPLSPKRLSLIIELAVKTAHYSDVDKYYDSFTEIKSKDNELAKYMSAALLVSSKKLFQKGEMYKAASYLKKASLSAAGRTNILLEVVTALASNRFILNAKQVLDEFPLEARGGVHYKIACAMVAFFEEPESEKHLSLLQKAIDDEVLEDGIAAPEYFYWLIAFLEAGKQNDQTKNLIETHMKRAKEMWPDRIDYFQKALSAILKKSESQKNALEDSL